ncbi:hypothetical protein [Robinsoniella sp. KNHs210]|nr:hypothetical protein [Robinsoniella sp. KNHs210]
MIGSVQKDGCGKLAWAVAGCSLLDAAQYVSAFCVKEDWPGDTRFIS